MPNQTPSQTVGPFFHLGLLTGTENVLVNEQTAGQRIRIVGTVYDGQSLPVVDALVEIWQPDAQGYFNHPADPHCSLADKHFHGFGRAGTTGGGRFEFMTVKPGPTPGRNGQLQAPYVDVRLFARGMLIHAVTRLYFSDEAANASDPLLTSIDPERRATLIALREESASLPTYRFDIRLQGDNETVFFEP
jgi:protocatechuate 3,4-dioxygenase alpha subunit